MTKILKSVTREFKMHSNDMTKRLMMNMSDSNISDVLNFFLLFARFEYALKQAGFLKKKRRAEPNWHSFSDGINVYLPSRKNNYNEFRNAIDYLNSCPPKIQIVKERNRTKVLDWECSKPQGNEARVLTEYIKRVRNNLFHGGKIPFNAERDIPLINHATTVLKHMLELESASKVKKCYYEGE